MGLTKEELDQRVAVLKRLKKSLSHQKDKFLRYLEVLDKEKESLARGDIEVLQSQVEMENLLVKEITVFQKTIAPVEEIYRMSHPEPEPEVQELQQSLSELVQQVQEKNKHNRLTLARLMEEINREMTQLRQGRKGSSPYGSKHSPGPSLVDIST